MKKQNFKILQKFRKLENITSNIEMNLKNVNVMFYRRVTILN